ncbi:MAG: peptidase [Bacteroidetes bacterium QH_7_62_13]|nr:MAG: peptidase [Bacteroidetes bacterium QH_7_62_13]
MKRILFVFLDGVGLGPASPSNPFSTENTAFSMLAGDQRWTQPFTNRSASDHVVRSLDATFGIEGLPQSGTGQASLLTGQNCAEMVGRHFGPFPHSETYDVLDHANLFHKVQALFPTHPAPTAFANAFPPQFFETTRRRSTVTTRCCKAAEVSLRDIDDLRNRRAIPADLTGQVWRDRLDLDVTQRLPAETAEVLAGAVQDHALTFFEYFLTDKVGHHRVDVLPSTLLKDLGSFLKALVGALDPSEVTVLITSDHGNLEDTTHTQHTRNPVPLIVHGWAAPYFEDAADLSDVTPGIVRALRSKNAPTK